MDTTFFIKTEAGGKRVNIPITSDNTYARCGECRKDFHIDLMYWADCIGYEGIELYGHTIFCKECTKKRRNKKAAS